MRTTKQFANKEIDFAYKVRRALDENLEHLPASAVQGLATARKRALAAQAKPSPLRLFFARRSTAGHAQHLVREPFSWITRAGFLLPAIVVAAGLVGIYQFEQQKRISEIAEIDALVLADELPLNAYVDKGFGAYLAERGE